MLGQDAPDANDPAQTPPVNSGSSPSVPEERPVSLKKLVPNLLSDQKRIWLFPAQPAQGHYWMPTLGVLAATAGLIASDPQTAPYFRTTRSFQGFNSVFSGRATAIGTVLAPSSLYIAGLLRKDSYAKNTALLAGEAVADSEILTTVLKDIDGRIRPVAVPSKGNFADTWFEGRGSILRGNGSFPSGHTIAAFSVAAVTARRYGRQHRWVPFVAYGAAAAVGFSRITLSSHFPSDVFMGAALGYSIGRFGVLRQ
ncbi:MAG TPA: phosphatase PAP2 family protein [Bryobacteraceae bacterium]|nr:phosphatase PAP2 family protein [Bryobacteraceae bacterium]